MEIIYSSEESRLDTSQGVGIALGNFDGVHVGHKALIDSVVELSNGRNLKSVVYTFINHPENFIAGQYVTPLITTNEQKSKLLKACGVDVLFYQDFSEVLMEMSPEKFVKSILLHQFNVRLIVVGFDYRFGYKGKGDVDYLKKMGIELGFDVQVVGPVTLDHTIVSSSLIRDLIRQGDMHKTARFLGRSYIIAGTVVKGKRLGNTIGFPTINIMPDNTIVLPKKGVYVTRTVINEEIYQSVTNVGDNPTVGDIGVRVETHILDYEADLYGKQVEIHFLYMIRAEEKFGSVEELKERINLDVLYTRDYFDVLYR